MDNIKTIVNNVTEVFVALLALAIVASLLVGPSNMAFLGDVAGNITALITSWDLRVVRPIASGVILMLFWRD